MSTTELLRYWPTKEDFTACIKTVAEASSEAVALAVHQPMTFDVRAVTAEGNSPLTTCDEGELLKAFLTDDLPEGRLIMPIAGDTGVGKSHVIRWLDAQLRRLPDNDRRLVIRIRKGMSLKGILKLILDMTPGEGLEKHRRAIEVAQESIDPLRAAGQLCEDLAQTLHERFEQAQQQLVENPADRAAQEIQSYCRPDMLPTLLRSEYLRNAHFVRREGADAGPVRRLVERLTESRDAADDDDRKREFVEDDLRIADRVDLRQLGPAEKGAVTALERDERRRTALRILNETLDSATQRLMRTDPAVGDLFDTVRRDLLTQQRELVLLVEDFVALVGLQRQLLEVVIKDAIRDGRQELCTMRTALAYTSGYAYMPDTVRTRAGVEYVIPNVPGDEESVFRRMERQVGAYLNAARLGQARLETAYRDGVHRATADRGWVPRFEVGLEPEDSATVAGFGSSEDAYELFPFNRAAIRALARDTATHDGRVSYNPRSVNQHIIRHVLQQRDHFCRNEFPPPGFGNTKLSIAMTNLVEQRVPRSEVPRYLRVLAYWGGRPDDLQEVALLPEQLFGAFGLERAPLVGDQPTGPLPPSPSKAGRTDSSTGQTKRPETEELEEQQRRGRESDPILEAWRSGTTLPQGKARDLRKSIAGAVARAVNWDWYLFRPQRGAKLDDWREHVFIPNAPGNEGRTPATAMLAVCEEEDVRDEIKGAQVTATLSAIHRLHETHRGSLDYDGADDDFPRYAAFVDRHAKPAAEWVLGRPLRAEWDPAPTIVQVLLVGARALGVPGADDNRNAATLMNAVFAQAPVAGPSSAGTAGSTTPSTTGVESFLEKLAFCRGLDLVDPESWRRLLLELTAARQGQAEKVYAVDALRLKALIDETKTTWEFTADVPPRGTGIPAFDRVKSVFSELRRLSSSVNREAQRLLEWRRGIIDWLGIGFDKDDVARELRETLELVKTEGLTGGVNAAAVSKLVEEFRAAAVVSTMDAVATLEGSPTRGILLTVIGQRVDPVVTLCSQLRDRYDELVRTAKHEQDVNIQAIGLDPVGEAARSLVTELERATSLVDGVQP